MPITSITGKVFTVKLGATDYSGQITQGSISRASNSEVIQTLSGKATVSIGSEDSASISFLFDEVVGLFGALSTAAAAGTSVTVLISDTVAKWTGPMVVTATSLDYSATGAVTGTADFLGTLVFSAV